MLIHFKLPDTEIKKALLNIDESILTVEKVKQLKIFAPTKEEKEALQKFQGDKKELGRAEQFFLEVKFSSPEHYVAQKFSRSSIFPVTSRDWIALCSN